MKTHVGLVLMGAAVIALPLVGCTKDSQKSATKASQKKITPGKVPESSKGPRSVYADASKIPKNPLAQRLCAALHQIPAENAAKCCQKSSLAKIVETQCIRVLSATLKAKTVSIAESDVARCEAAMKETHNDCRWVGGPWKPDVPAACDGLVVGVLEKGARCRSSLECQGNLHCEDAGASDYGTCAPPEGEGSTCSSSVDQLATYTRQDSTEARHPECDGYCYKHKCRPFHAEGVECVNNLSCGPGARCDGGKCVKGAVAKSGGSCTQGGCEAGTECVSGLCVALKGDGEVCSTSFECMGGCLKQKGANKGICGTQCRAPFAG